MKQNTVKMEIGLPYSIIFSNEYLVSQYMKEKTGEERMLKKGGRNVENKKHKFSKTTLKILKTTFVCVGSCATLVGYISLMILGGFVLTLML